MGISRCPACHGTGRCYAERNSSLSHKCPDCDGTGHVEYCEECEAALPAHQSPNGLCNECAEKLLAEADND